MTRRTIFETPIISTFMRMLASLVLWISGWRIEGKLPDLKKYVIIGAPHTSNWDFVLFLGAILHLKASVRYMGKAELFRGPFAWFFYWCGGIPVNRGKSHGLVEQMVDAFNASETFALTITPEGTRHYVAEWKMGFYHIAKQAGVPVVMAVVDGKKKILRIGAIYHLTENADKDMKNIKGFFAGMQGINPRRKYITLEG